MWITLMQTIASAARTGHGSCVTSKASGGRTFASFSWAIHAAIEAWRSRSISLGWNTKSGNARAK